ncbi:MAG: ATP-binding protein [Deltaproteobacteria bacterium]
MPSTSSDRRIGFEQLEIICPFHLLIGEDFRLVRLSHRLERLWPELAANSLLQDVVVIVRPRGVQSIEQLVQLTGMVIHLSVRSHPSLILRGQIIKLAAQWLFVGTPKISSVKEMTALGLELSDLPLHDSGGDFLMAMETSQSLLKESMQFAEELQVALEKEKETQVQLRTAKEAAEAANEAKNQIMANTSHELRTPLHGIINLADLIRIGASGPVSPQAVQDLEMIINSASRLNSLVNDILDFSKLQKQQLEIQHKPVDLFQVTENSLALLKPLHREKPIDLQNELTKDLPLVDGDEDRIQQILFNLLGNALKFTESGEVRLSAVVQDGWVEVAVADTGIGIPQDKQERIFDAFEQGDASTERTHGGTGLGLSVAKQLIELHGGRIWLESVVGQGSVFRFTLPCSSASEQERKEPVVSKKTNTTKALPVAVATVPVVEEEPGLERNVDLLVDDPSEVTILVVDDEPINRQVLRNQLEMVGYRVEVAIDGLQGLKLLEKLNPQVILLDVMMPRLSGYQTCYRIRQKYSASELPIILLTAKDQPEDTVRGFQHGANDYLTKPFSREELLIRVRFHLKLSKATSEVYRMMDDLRGMQNQLIQSAKLAAVGEMTSGIAHELKTPLAGISTILSGVELARQLHQEIDMDATCSRVSLLVKRCSAIIEHMRNYSRRTEETHSQTQIINQLLKNTLLLVEPQLKRIGGKLELHLGHDLPFVRGNDIQLEQVFINLCNNACDAMEQSKERILTIQSMAEGDAVVVRVSDTGTGMRPEVQERIFESFFTTKSADKGTGLGMSISQNIIEQHGGRILFQSEEGKGSTFEVRLSIL